MIELVKLIIKVLILKEIIGPTLQQTKLLVQTWVKVHNNFIPFGRISQKQLIKVQMLAHKKNETLVLSMETTHTLKNNKEKIARCIEIELNKRTASILSELNENQKKTENGFWI